MSNEQERMVFENMKLIYFVMQKMNLYHKCEELFDLGLIGLIKGVKTYDDSKNIKLNTYLYACIKNEFISYLRKKTPETISFDTEIGEDLTLFDTLEDSSVHVEEDIFEQESLKQIIEVIKTFPKDEQFIICSFYGICGNEKLNQQEIAIKLGVSQANVCRKIRKIISKIKEAVL